MKLHYEKTSQSFAERVSFKTLCQTINQTPALNGALFKVDKYLFINDFALTEPWRKYIYTQELSLLCKAFLFTYTAKECKSFVWKIPIDEDEKEILIQNNKFKSSIEKRFPHVSH